MTHRETSVFVCESKEERDTDSVSEGAEVDSDGVISEGTGAGTQKGSKGGGKHERL